MTEPRNAAANRRNCRNGRGPRSPAGRFSASRNALRHGFAALVHHRAAPNGAVESFARALCGSDNDAALLEQARVIAAHMLTLRTITDQQTAMVERLFDETAIALAKGDNTLTLMQARFMQAWLADYEIRKQVPALLAKYQNELPPTPAETDRVSGIPYRLLAMLDDPHTPAQQQQALALATMKVAQLGRDEHDALAEAIPDLLRLERYAYRSFVRLKRAMYAFMNVKLLHNLRDDVSA